MQLKPIASCMVPVDIQISDIEVTSESRVKLLGIHMDNRLSFDYHVKQLCKKTSKKLYALHIIFKDVETSKRRVLVNVFITSQFSYCSLIWMFRSRRMVHGINKIHERALHLIYSSDSKLTFKELLDKNKTVSIHQKKLTSTSRSKIQSKAKYFTKNIKRIVFF